GHVLDATDAPRDVRGLARREIHAHVLRARGIVQRVDSVAAVEGDDAGAAVQLEDVGRVAASQEVNARERERAAVEAARAGEGDLPGVGRVGPGQAVAANAGLDPGGVTGPRRANVEGVTARAGGEGQPAAKGPGCAVGNLEVAREALLRPIG